MIKYVLCASTTPKAEKERPDLMIRDKNEVRHRSVDATVSLDTNLERAAEFTGKLNTYTFFFMRNHFISNLVLDCLNFKKVLELHGKS